MTKTVNPDLIKALHECYEDRDTPVDVCKKFGLQYPGPTIKVGLLADSQFAENLPPKGSDFYKNPERAASALFYTHKDPDQDALNLFAFFVYETTKTNHVVTVDILGILSKHYKSIFKRLPVQRLHGFFDRLQSYGLLDLFEKTLDQENVELNASLPRDLPRKLEQWKNLPKNRALFAPQTPEQHPQSPEPAPTSDTSKPAPIDLDAIIAKKQKYFDEVPTANILDAFLERDRTSGNEIGSYTKTIFSAIDPLSSSFVKNMLRAVSQIKMPPNLKRAASLLWTLGLYGDYAKGVIDDDLKSKRSQENLSNVWVHSLTDADISSYIFESARRLDYLPDLYFMMNSTRSAAKPEHVEKLKNWCASRNIDLRQMLVDYELMPVIEGIDLEAADPRDAIIAEKQAWFDEMPYAYIAASLPYSMDISFLHEGGDSTADYTQISDYVRTKHPAHEAFVVGFYRHVERMERPLTRKAALIAAKNIFFCFDTTIEDEKLDPVALTGRRMIWQSTFYDEKTRNYIFAENHKYAFLPAFYFLANAEGTLIPPETTAQLREWCSQNGIDLKQMLADYDLPVMPEHFQNPEQKATAEPLLPNAVTIVEVDGKLVDVGRATEMLAVDRNPDNDAPAPERLRVPHVEWLLEDIPGLMDLDGPITLYRSRQEREKGEDKDFSLQVIEFKTTDGNKHQIATNNWYAGGTYIIKPAADINPNDPKLVHIPDLLGSGKAWPVRCHNRTQYVIAALQLCETPLAELSPYIPRLSWADKALAVTETCIALLKETGERIKTNDKEALQTGPLRGISTAGRVAAAINNGAIGNLGADDLPDFYNKLFERDPALKDHLHKPTIDAARIFADAAAFIREHDIVPQVGFLDAIELAGHPAERVSRFFAQTAEGSIIGWRKLLPGRSHIPSNLDDFMVATGLAIRVEKDGLWPNYDHPALKDGAPKQAHG